MPPLHPVSCLGLVLEYDHLIASALLNNIGDDFSAFDNGLAQGDLFPVRDKVDLIQLNSTALSSKFIYINHLPRGDLVLFAPGFNYGVNGCPPAII